MITTDELKVQLAEHAKAVKDLEEALAIEASRKRVQELEHTMSRPGFYDDAELSKKVFDEVGDLKGKLNRFEKLQGLYDDAETMLEMLDEEYDPAMVPEAEEAVNTVGKAVEELQLMTMLNGEYDHSNAILTFHAGTGGTEAQDWAEMLYRMYNKWAQAHGMTVEPNNERRYVNMAVTGIGTYASYTNSYGNTQNAGNKTGRTYKNAHEYKNYLTQKYDCLRSRDYSVNINSSLLSEAMGDEKTKQWLEYNLSLIPKTIEQSRAYVAARGAKILSYSITIDGYDSMSSVMCTQDEVDPGTEKARKELEERLEKRKAEKKETEERLEKQRAEKQEQEEWQYNLKIDGKDVADLTGKMVELVGTSIPIGVTESGVSTFDVLA